MTTVSAGSGTSSTTAATPGATATGFPSGYEPTLTDFYIAVLENIGAPLTASNILTMQAWQSCEGGVTNGAANNPFNTTWPGSSQGSTGPTTVNAGSYGVVNINGPINNNPSQNGGNPVKSYGNFASGVSATSATIAGHPTLLAAFQNDAGPSVIAASLSGWGTSPDCLSSKGEALVSSTPVATQTALENYAEANVGNIIKLVGANRDLGVAVGQGITGGVATALANKTGVGGALSAAEQVTNGTASVLKWLTNKNNWIRIGMIVGGAVILLVSVGGLFRESIAIPALGGGGGGGNSSGNSSSDPALESRVASLEKTQAIIEEGDEEMYQSSKDNPNTLPEGTKKQRVSGKSVIGRSVSLDDLVEDDF